MSKYKLYRYELGTGDTAIHNTVDMMKYYALMDKDHKVVTNIADEIRKDCDGSQECEVETAFNYVVETIRYETDAKNLENYISEDDLIESYEMTEFTQRPSKLLDTSNTDVLKQGDCDDLTMCLMAILFALGYSVQVKVIATETQEYSHVLLNVLIENEKDNKMYWLELDPTIGDIGKGVVNSKRDDIFTVSPTDINVIPNLPKVEMNKNKGVGFLNVTQDLNDQEYSLCGLGEYGQKEFIEQWKKDMKTAFDSGKASYETIALEITTNYLTKKEFSSPTMEAILEQTIKNNYTKICGDAAKDKGKSFLQENKGLLIAGGAGLVLYNLSKRK